MIECWLIEPNYWQAFQVGTFSLIHIYLVDIDYKDRVWLDYLMQFLIIVIRDRSHWEWSLNVPEMLRCFIFPLILCHSNEILKNIEMLGRSKILLMRL